MKYFPPDAEELELNTIILDLNGTLAVNCKIPSGVEESIKALKALNFTIVLFTFDFQSEAALQAAEMGIELVKTNNQAEKTAAAGQRRGACGHRRARSAVSANGHQEGRGGIGHDRRQHLLGQDHLLRRGPDRPDDDAARRPADRARLRRRDRDLLRHGTRRDRGQ
jgi:hypothetical protein